MLFRHKLYGIAAALLALLACALAGCGNNSSGDAAGLSRPATATAPSIQQPSAQYESASIDLNATLAQLAGMQAPAGVDPAVFAQLKDQLAKVLRYYYGGGAGQQMARKSSSGLGPEALSQPWCADARVTTGGQITLAWRGRHAGDYDVNGEVNISDITPLGMYFGQTCQLDDDGLPVVSGDNEIKSQVDGDGNTEINIADITPIGVNFSSRLTGYRVYYGLDSGSGTQWEQDSIPNPDDPASDVSLPFASGTGAGQVLQYSLVFSRPEVAPELGEFAFVNIVPFDGVAEGAGTIIPLQPGVHAPQGCKGCHKLTDYTFRGLDGACKACHTTPPEDGAAAWTSAPGMHGDCLSCHARHRFTITPPTVVCSSCHSAIATDAAAANMADCLSCHLTPHLPNPQPSKTQCATCHSDKAAGLADELMQECTQCHSSHTFAQTYTPQFCESCHVNPDNNTSLDWANAPGAHGSCSNCHTLHDFKITAEPNSLCANCHQNKIDDNHSLGNLDCLGCHNSPHMPAIPGSANCTQCHPIPPGQPGKTWADAPGLHASCGECHDPATHGDKPVPPESVCVNCHAALMAQHAPNGMTCADCHNGYYHVPDVTRGNAGCVLCHPTPPENPAAAWASAPGQHAECLSCHPGPHPDKPTPPESVCGGCHSTIVAEVAPSSMTQCLGCHQAPHLPLAVPGPAQCQTCHPHPPEQPAANWADAPGLHNQCSQCHTGHVFTQTWTNAFCQTCHPSSGHVTLPGGHSSFSCKQCHVRQHMPEGDQAVICVTCHDAGGG